MRPMMPPNSAPYNLKKIHITLKQILKIQHKLLTFPLTHGKNNPQIKIPI